MTTGLTYAQYVTQMATLAVVAENDPAFVIILPQMITYAENRICRDLDFLSTQSSITGNRFASGSRTITISAGTLVTSQQVNVITPSSTSNPNSGTRNPCLPVTKEFLDQVYGASTYTGMPLYFAPFNDNIFYFGPYPDDTYYIEIVGTVRPTSLAATNTTTFISTYLPDLMIMASMIYVTGYQRDFGKVSDQPDMGMSYEQQYQLLMKSASVEEARKKFWSSGWTSMSPAVAASPTRG